MPCGPSKPATASAPSSSPSRSAPCQRSAGDSPGCGKRFPPLERDGTVWPNNTCPCDSALEIKNIMAVIDSALPSQRPADQLLQVPVLADDATPEEKDLHWYKHVYQGDSVPQLTLRAILMGGCIGMAMCCAHLYTVLKVGWSFGVAITACVMSYVIWSLIRAISGNRL